MLFKQYFPIFANMSEKAYRPVYESQSFVHIFEIISLPFRDAIFELQRHLVFDSLTTLRAFVS